jgi:hypothetical protein
MLICSMSGQRAVVAPLREEQWWSVKPLLSMQTGLPLLVQSARGGPKQTAPGRL